MNFWLSGCLVSGFGAKELGAVVVLAELGAVAISASCSGLKTTS